MNYTVERFVSGKDQITQWRPAETTAAPEGLDTIELLPNKRFQTMLGFGGAFTEAAAYTLDRMPRQARAEILRRLFDPNEGLGYSLGRIPIHSCDFSLGNYTYVNDGDVSLESFNLEREERLLFPLVRDAETFRGSRIPLLASPWSPPAWMKDSGEMNNGGSLLPEHRDTWARYFVRYVRGMREKGFDVWGVTVQNEPAAVQTWESCIYSAEEERDFVRDYLGPGFKGSGLGDVKILVWDHNRDLIVERAKGILSDPDAAKYIWGTGFHWYVSEEFENVGKVHDLFPDKHLLFTEGCQEGGVHLGSWQTGERYVRNMIGDFNNWCEGYLDWNLVLDETGGPNHVGNLCDAPIIADTRTGEIHYNSSYYAIGHFSRFVLPGATRIGVSGVSKVPMTAFRNPDGGMVAVLLNEGDKALPYALSVEGSATRGILDPHSVMTVVWSPGDV